MDALERESNIQQVPALTRLGDFPELFFLFLHLTFFFVHPVLLLPGILGNWIVFFITGTVRQWWFTPLNTIKHIKSEIEEEKQIHKNVSPTWINPVRKGSQVFLVKLWNSLLRNALLKPCALIGSWFCICWQALQDHKTVLCRSVKFFDARLKTF